MDTLMKRLDGSKPGKLPHVILAVDENDQVRVWQLCTIYYHEVITVD